MLSPTDSVKYLRVIPVLYPEFFGHTGTCTGTGILAKVLENAPSDRQTDKKYGSI